MKKLFFTILLVMVLTVSMAVPALAATTQDVTITATPTYIALTNDTATWAVGTVTISTTYWWSHDGAAPDEPFTDGECKAIITNTGSVAEDIDIHCHAATGGAGWAISADDSPADDEFSLRSGISGMANEAAMLQTVLAPADLKTNLAASAHVHWLMELETGTAFSDGVAKEIIVTLTATAT